MAGHLERAKDKGAWPDYRRGIRLAAELWRGADESLRDAMRVSFLEHLSFDGARGREAWEHLPKDLQEAWRAVDAEWKAFEAKNRPPRKRKGKSR